MRSNHPVGNSDDNIGRATKETARFSLVKWAVFFLAGLTFCLSLWLVTYAVRPVYHGPDEKIEVFIPMDTGFRKIKKILTDNGVISDDIRFTLLARFIGAAHRLKAGEYIFYPGQTPYQILIMLEEGKVIQRAVTIPEGLNLQQIADIWSAGGWVDRDKFLALTTDQAMIKDLKLQAASLEGYLFPDTYHLTKGYQSEVEIIKMMVGRFTEVYEEIRKEVKSEVPFSRHEVVTLASIVEKETAQPQERPLIARVFLNRLKKNMRLQADPTVIYGRDDFSGNLTRQDLEEPSPYNTYTIKGLPPGPIASPGRAAIEAVLKPAEGDFLYFVSRNDGTHYFSRNLAEHNRAVAKYQK